MNIDPNDVKSCPSHPELNLAWNGLVGFWQCTMCEFSYSKPYVGYLRPRPFHEIMEKKFPTYQRKTCDHEWYQGFHDKEASCTKCKILK